MLITRSVGLLPALLLSLAPSLALSETTTASRLVVADHQAPQLRVLDMEGRELLRLDTREPARLYEGAHSGQVAVRETRHGRVTFLETGLRWEGHGDHGDLRVDVPRRLAAEWLGPRPSHIVASDGMLAAFFDGDGSVLLAEDSEARRVRRLSAAHAHHRTSARKPATSVAGGIALARSAPCGV